MVEIKDLLNCPEDKKPNNFFVFSGAGSGKTYTLVSLLHQIKDRWGDIYKREKRQIAVITYTNAATDEILRRVKYDNLFHISTIHSFVWDLIKSFQTDIKKVYVEMKKQEMFDLQEKQEKATNPTTKTYTARAEKISKIHEKLENTDSIVKFSYDPNGDNFDRTSLNHEDVIKIGAELLNKPMLQKIVSQQFPFVLVDESQDTKSVIVDSIKALCTNTNITVGFIGDIKQRIYSDGKTNMSSEIPEEWNKPILTNNYRSNKRIVELGNKIGMLIDQNAEQQATKDNTGFVRIFIVQDKEGLPKDTIEQEIAQKMATYTGDAAWNNLEKVKMLVLEHHMAAKRMFFLEFYEALAHIPKYSQSFNQGKVSDMSLFSNLVLPLYQSYEDDDFSKQMMLIRSHSPLMDLKEGDDVFENLKKCNVASKELTKLINEGQSIRKIIEHINSTNLFKVPSLLTNASSTTTDEVDVDTDEAFAAWVKVMDLPFWQVIHYYEYVNDQSKFATHQGVKGLQFPRVMVIMNDYEAKGFLFSYEKVFGALPLSKSDIKNKDEGKDTSIDRTLRLLYVTCTRAEESLALVLYTKQTEAVKKTCLQNSWFTEEEITIL